MKLRKERAIEMITRGLTVKEVATVLDVSPASIYTALYRAGVSSRPPKYKQEIVYDYCKTHDAMSASMHFGISLDCVYALCSRQKKKLLTASKEEV